MTGGLGCGESGSVLKGGATRRANTRLLLMPHLLGRKGGPGASGVGLWRGRVEEGFGQERTADGKG